MPKRRPLQATSSGARNLEAPGPQKDAGAPKSLGTKKMKVQQYQLQMLRCRAFAVLSLNDYHGNDPGDGGEWC